MLGDMGGVNSEGQTVNSFSFYGPYGFLFTNTFYSPLFLDYLLYKIER